MFCLQSFTTQLPYSIIQISVRWIFGTFLYWATADLRVIDAVALSDHFTECWFETDLDHFNFQTRKNISLRYFVDDQFVQKSTSTSSSFSATPISNHTPVLLYAGNEADINVFIKNSGGFMVETAEELNALVVFAEHRYYGHSVPYQTDGTVDLAFLTVEQALADFNLLTVHLRQKYDSFLTPQSAFIVFGGSYGGNLALWLRLKYPNLWAGAIASSATPLKHILRTTNDFANIETQVYGNVSQACPDFVRTGWQELFGNATSQHGRMILKDALGLCDPIVAMEEAEFLHDWISDALETLVQYGYPYPTDFYEPVPAFPFRVACERMLKAQSGLGALRAALDVFHNSTAQAGICYDTPSIFRSVLRYNWKRGDHARMYNFETTRFLTTKRLQTPRLRRKLLTTEEAWEYQTCTEVFQPMPTDGVTDFEIPYTPDPDQYFQRCDEKFGVQPIPDWEETMFGGIHIESGSNIFLTHGQLDPWRAAGIQELKNQPPSIQIRVIENGAHHYDLRASHPDDVSSVITVRNEEKDAIRVWIREWEQQGS